MEQPFESTEVSSAAMRREAIVALEWRMFDSGFCTEISANPS
jgi:hypothetical protein